MGKGSRRGAEGPGLGPAQVSAVSALVPPAALLRDAPRQASEWGQGRQLEALPGHLRLAGPRALSSLSGPLF